MMSSSKSNNRKRQPLAQTIADNEDLLIEILLRVPAKPLLKLKSVSKVWRSLISSSRFIRLHTLRNYNSVVSGFFLGLNPTQFQFLSLDTKQVSPFPLSFTHDDPSGIYIFQSCNGLLLFSDHITRSTDWCFYVYNPTTNRCFTLPRHTVGEKKRSFFGVNLVFDPSQSLSYKVVCVHGAEKLARHSQVEIYESDSGAWRLSGSPFASLYDVEFFDGAFWNDSIHWIGSGGKSVCFDMKIECLKKMPNLPLLGSGEERRIRHLVESNGHLHLFETYSPRSTRIKVFEMERDYSNWFIKYDLCLDVISTAYPEMVMSYFEGNDYQFAPLLFVREQNGVDASMFLYITGKILSYNVMDRTFKQLFEFDDAAMEPSSLGLEFGFLGTHPYFQSLVPV